ncbi:MAG: hypothetical protein GY851_32120 [bacterium]|nr:hypothetical protein [bacterium]
MPSLIQRLLYKRSPAVRLSRFIAQQRSYTYYIGTPLENATGWVVVRPGPDHALLDVAGGGYPLDQVTAYVVAYPNGDILGCDIGRLPMPKDAQPIGESSENESDVLSDGTLAEGNRYVRVTHSGAQWKCDDMAYYTTSVTNLATKPLRVLRFAAYKPKGQRYVMRTVTDAFFTAEDFRMWYGMEGSDWIQPGETVTDPNNFGAPPTLWAYYCEIEAGPQFVAGAVKERRRGLLARFRQSA